MTTPLYADQLFTLPNELIYQIIDQMDDEQKIGISLEYMEDILRREIILKLNDAYTVKEIKDLEFLLILVKNENKQIQGTFQGLFNPCFSVDEYSTHGRCIRCASDDDQKIGGNLGPVLSADFQLAKAHYVVFWPSP